MKAYLKFIILAMVAAVLVAGCASATPSSSSGPGRGGRGGYGGRGGRGARVTTLASFNAQISPIFPGNGSTEVEERSDLLIQNVNH